MDAKDLKKIVAANLWQCANCLYCGEQGLANRRCHRHVGQPARPGGKAEWPIVREDDYCGEFEQRPTAFTAEAGRKMAEAMKRRG